MLEPMDLFFEARLEGYDAHMLRDIAGAEEFYPFTAAALPAFPGCRVLDLGCGTGLELEFYFRRVPEAAVTGIDLSEKMLAALRGKFPDKALRLIRGSYFDTPLGEDCFDAAVSVESLHHFTQEEKTAFYRKVFRSLKPGGFFILTDYFAESDEEEAAFREELLRLMEEDGIRDGGLYHFDTPLTLAHETQALTGGGFSQVVLLGTWGATRCIKATKLPVDPSKLGDH